MTYRRPRIPRRCLLIPGRHETQESSTANLLRALGWAPLGPSLDARLLRRPFAEQVAAVRRDVEAVALGEGAPVIARSFGAYLFLQALLELSPSGPFPAPALLLAPVLGGATARHASGSFGAQPPRARTLRRRIADGTFPEVARLDIHIGDADICAEQAVDLTLRVPNVTCDVVPGVIHAFPPELEKGYLMAFLGTV